MAMIKKWLIRVVVFLVFIVALVAASDNSQEVPLSFLDYQTPAWPISWWVLLAFVLGVLFGVLLNLVSNTRLRLQTGKVNRALKQEKAEVNKIKAGVSG